MAASEDSSVNMDDLYPEFLGEGGQGDMDNESLKVATAPFFPYSQLLVINKTQTKTLIGPMIDILNYLAESIKFKYILIPMAQQGIFRNNTWNGIMGALIEETVDIAAAPFMINEERFEYIWYTPYIMSQTITILGGQDVVEAGAIVDFIVPFLPEIWGLVFGMIFLIVIIHHIIKRIEFREKNLRRFGNFELFCRHAIQFFSGFVGEGMEEAGVFFLSERLLTGIYWLFSLMAVWWYSSYLSSNMVLGDDTAVIQNIQDLGSLRHIQPLLIKGTSVVTMFENSNEDGFVQVWKNIKRIGIDKCVILGKDIYNKTNFKRVMHQKAAIVAGSVSSDFRLSSVCSELSGQGGSFYFAKETFFPHFISMATRKTLPEKYQKSIHKKMRSLTEFGVTAQLFEKVRLKMRTCISHNGDTEYNPLGLIAIQQIFIVWAGGFTFSFIVLLIEFFLKSIRKKSVFKTAPKVNVLYVPRSMTSGTLSKKLNASGSSTSKRRKGYNFWKKVIEGMESEHHYYSWD